MFFGKGPRVFKYLGSGTDGVFLARVGYTVQGFQNDDGKTGSDTVSRAHGERETVSGAVSPQAVLLRYMGGGRLTLKGDYRDSSPAIAGSE